MSRKRSYVHAPGDPGTVATRGVTLLYGPWAGPWCSTGGYNGWVYRGSTPSHLARGEQALTAKRAPDCPCRGQGVGGQGAAGACLLDHPSGPVGTPRCPSLSWIPAFQSKSGANGQTARLRSIFSKVSQKRSSVTEISLKGLS